MNVDVVGFLKLEDLCRGKKVIEFFGEYYHGEKKTGRNKEQEEKLRIDHFRKYGFDCLVIWGSELKDFTLLKGKIKNFTYGGK